MRGKKLKGISTVAAVACVVGGVALLSAQGAGASGAGMVTGLITDAAGDPVEGVWVQAYTSDGSVWVGSQSEVTSTNSAGRYSIKLEAGDYRLCFYDESGSYANACYGDGVSASTGSTLTVTNDSTTDAAMTMSVASHLQGKVSTASGDAADGVLVGAYRRTEGSWTLVTTDFTNSRGIYDIGALPAGEYHIGFAVGDANAGNDGTWATTYYGGTSLSDALDLNLPQGWTSTGLDGSVTTISDAAQGGQPTPPSTVLTAPSGLRIEGAAAVGQELQVVGAVPQAWSPAADQVTYQWFSDTRAIAGAVDDTLRVAPDVVGTDISVTVTAVKSGFATAALSSPSTRVTAAAATPTPSPSPQATTTTGGVTPTPDPATTTPASSVATAGEFLCGKTVVGVKGAVRVGRKVQANTGSCAPLPSTTRYQWYASGKAIRGATGRTYTIKRSLRGKQVSVKVTVTRAGYGKLVRTSSSYRVR